MKRTIIAVILILISFVLVMGVAIPSIPMNGSFPTDHPTEYSATKTAKWTTPTLTQITVTLTSIFTETRTPNRTVTPTETDAPTETSTNTKQPTTTETETQTITPTQTEEETITPTSTEKIKKPKGTATVLFPASGEDKEGFNFVPYIIAGLIGLFLVLFGLFFRKH